MKQTYLTLLLFFLSLQSAAQLVQFELNDLDFHSEFERQQFVADGGAFDRLGILLAVDPLAHEGQIQEIQDRIQETVNLLEAKNIRSKKLEKQVKLIFSVVQERFLFKYEFLAFFPELFESGTFNCVTASILYALVLEKFDIDYDIIELPTHVFLIVDPDGQQILLESTDPRGGVFAVDERFMEQRIAILVDAKIISQRELETKSIRDIYSEYYQEGTKIDFQRLLSIHYSNFAVDHLMREENLAAYQIFKKSYFLYPEPINENNMATCLAYYLKNQDFNESKVWPYLSDFVELIDTVEASSLTIRNYKALTHDLLLSKDDTASYFSMHEEFIRFKLTKKTMDEILFTHHINMAQWCDYKKLHSESIQHCLFAHQLQPKDIQVKQLVFQGIASELERKNKPLEVISLLDEYQLANPWLRGENDFAIFYNLAFLFEANRLYRINKVGEADDYVQKIVDSGEHGKIPDEYIADLYGEAWRAYVRLDNYKVARQKVEAGLALSPDNLELKRFLENLKREGY